MFATSLSPPAVAASAVASAFFEGASTAHCCLGHYSYLSWLDLCVGGSFLSPFYEMLANKLKLLALKRMGAQWRAHCQANEKIVE